MAIIIDQTEPLFSSSISLANVMMCLMVSIAAARHGIVYTLSTIATSSIEQIAEAAPDGNNWFQLYIYKDRYCLFSASLADWLTVGSNCAAQPQSSWSAVRKPPVSKRWSSPSTRRFSGGDWPTSERLLTCHRIWSETHSWNLMKKE